MNNYIINPLIVEMLKEIESVLSNFQAKYYYVGAFARDMLLKKHGLTAQRSTNDVDIAIMLDIEEDFYKVKAEFINTGKFKPHPTETIKLFYKESVELDIMPFGDIENIDSETILTKPKLFILDVPGFKELVPYTDTITTDGISLNISPLEGIVILKLLANDDRPDRTKDITDIEHFVSVYFDINTEEIYNVYHDVINQYESAEGRYFQQLVSARIIGRKIKDILNTSPLLFGRIKQILANRTNLYWQAMYDGTED